MNAYPQICRKANLKVYNNPQLVIDEFLKKLKRPKIHEIHLKNTCSYTREQLLEKEIQYHKNLRLSICKSYNRAFDIYNETYSNEPREISVEFGYRTGLFKRSGEYSKTIQQRVRNLCLAYFTLGTTNYEKFIDIYVDKLWRKMYDNFYGFSKGQFSKEIRRIFYDYIVPEVRHDFDMRMSRDETILTLT